MGTALTLHNFFVPMGTAVTQHLMGVIIGRLSAGGGMTAGAFHAAFLLPMISLSLR